MQQTDGIKPNFHVHITLFIEALKLAFIFKAFGA